MPLVDKDYQHVINISGKDSLCTAIVQKARKDLPYRYVFSDTYLELPETYAWLDMVEAKLGIRIERVGKSLEEVIAEQGMLPSHQSRFCTRLAKIYPMHDWLKGPTIQYVGIRADEGRPLQSIPVGEVHSRYPLVEMGINLPMVYLILSKAGISPPNFFWQRLWDAVYEQCAEFSQEYMLTLNDWERYSLFSWRSRSNCFMCFYQRLYEWIGLLEHHPELYERAEKLEKDWGSGDRRGRDFTLRSDGTLSSLRSRADEIFWTHVSKVKWAVVRKSHLAYQGEEDLQGGVSCGAYCGK